MVRTLIATMVMSASMSVACPTCGCSDAKTETVSANAKECSTECASTCDTTAAATLAVSDATSGECCGASSCDTEAATMTVAGDGKDCAATCDAASTCSTAAGISYVGYMPAMTYKVGDETMTCSKMAGAKASEKSTHMHYVVKGVEYDDQAKAMSAHAKQLESMMMDLVRVQYAVDGECVACPDAAKEMAASCESKSLQYRVGPATFNKAEDAIKASIMAYNAAMNTKMEYAVGEETTTCSVSAGEMAKAQNCSVEYVVNGQRTNCKTSAGYMKTLASVQNALKALETAAMASTDA